MWEGNSKNYKRKVTRTIKSIILHELFWNKYNFRIRTLSCLDKGGTTCNISDLLEVSDGKLQPSAASPSVFNIFIHSM